MLIQEDGLEISSRRASQNCQHSMSLRAYRPPKTKAGSRDGSLLRGKDSFNSSMTVGLKKGAGNQPTPVGVKLGKFGET